MPAWSLAETDPVRADAFARALGVRPVTAQLLLNRGHATVDGARRWLGPRLADLRRPDGEFAMAGFERAAERLLRALSEREPIGLFGDYDVDGVTTCALLATYLGDAGGRVVARVASRSAGYGFGVADVDRFAADGCRVIVTCDLGTSDVASLAHARARGIDVIVVDHHQVPDGDPGAYALINPHQPSCRFPFKGLCSAGVGFYLAARLRTRLRDLRRDAPDPRALLDLVALGTVADMAPLTDENRVLVTAGLRELALRKRPGLRALAELAGVDATRAPSTSDIGFKLAPRLNAPGRLGEAQRSLELLLASDGDAPLRAQVCDEANRQRQEVQERVFQEALALLDGRPPSASVVVAGDGWHPGVVGIVAAKLVERYHRPTIVIALDGDEGRGSARTVGNVHLYRALHRLAPLLVRYGGHAAAAGLTVARDRLPEFARAFDAEVAAQQGAHAPTRSLAVDAEVPFAEIDERLAEELAAFAPFGVANPEPVLLARDLSLDGARVVGERHLLVTLRAGAHVRDGIGFRLAPEGDAPVAPGERVAALFVPEIDTWRGARRLRLRLHHIEPHAPVAAVAVDEVAALEAR